MTTLEAIAILEVHQKWRLGNDAPMVHPKLLTKAINLILKELNKKI